MSSPETLVHEAGHAVVALHYGITFRGILSEYYPVPIDDGVFEIRAPCLAGCDNYNPDGDEILITVLAGTVSQIKYEWLRLSCMWNDPRFNTDTSSRHDMIVSRLRNNNTNDFEFYLNQRGDDSEILRTYIDSTIQLVDRYWREIWEVAEDLIENNELTFDQVRQIVETI